MLFALGLVASPAGAATEAERLALAAPEPSLVIEGPEAGPPGEGPGGLVITWNTGTGVLAGLERSIDGGPFERIGQFDPVIQVTTDGAPAAAKQEFRLSQVGADTKVLVTATLQNGKVTITKVARPVPPRDTAAWIDKLIQLAPYAIFALFAVLIALYLWSLRGLRRGPLETEAIDAA